MNKKIILAVSVALIVSGCGASGSSNVESKKEQPSSVPDCIDKSDVESSALIRLTSPQKNQVVKSPFLVGGEAQLPGDIVYVRIKKPNGDVLISEQASIKAEKGEQGPFGVLISFQFQATNEGTVEVYGIDPETSDEVALQDIEVSFDTSSSGATKIPN